MIAFARSQRISRRRDSVASTSTPAATVAAPAPDGRHCSVKAGKARRPAGFRITLTASAGLVVRRGLLAVVMQAPGRRPVLVEITPPMSANDCAASICSLPFGWRAILSPVTIASEPPAKGKGGKPGVFVRVPAELDVWPGLAAVIVSGSSHPPTIDSVSPMTAASVSVRSLNLFSDDATTRAAARRVVILAND